MTSHNNVNRQGAGGFARWLRAGGSKPNGFGSGPRFASAPVWTGPPFERDDTRVGKTSLLQLQEVSSWTLQIRDDRVPACLLVQVKPNCQSAEYRLTPFSCAVCSSPAIALPSKIEDHSPVKCRRCNAIIGTWGELKERALRSASGVTADGPLSSDPLPSPRRLTR